MTHLARINLLDKKTAELIAAGEVIERPSSVVKELVENAIDSGAGGVTVEIRNGGVKLIRVTDNGCGIEREDLPKAFLRHATSKVASAEDLYCIGTLGFRGEALASICAVSRVELLTRVATSSLGYSYRVDGGEEQGEPAEAGCPQGSSIYVRDLFYNIPARMKFLKKDVTEGNAIATLLDRLALSHPEVSFRFIREGKPALQTPGDGKLLSAIYAVYGKEFGTGLIPVKGGSSMIEVTGYITKPEKAKATRTMEHFFINDRYVRSVTVMAAMEEAYKNSLMTGKFPGCVLHITIPFGSVDVNVHPAKLEVKLSDERAVFDAVYSACKGALSTMEQGVHAADTAGSSVKSKLNFFDLTNRPLAGEQQQMSAAEYRATVNHPYKAMAHQELRDSPAAKLYLEQLKNSKQVRQTQPQTAPKADRQDEPQAEYPKPTHAFTESSSPVETALPVVTGQSATAQPITTQPVLSQLPAAQPAPGQSASHQPIDSQAPPLLIGEAFATYLLAQQGDQLLLVDKHAAHERILFEQFKKEQQTGCLSRQLLLTSVRLSFSKELYGALVTNLALLEQLGFVAEDFGNGSLLLREMPAMLGLAQLEDTLLEVGQQLLNGSTRPEIGKLDDLLHTMACKAAVKGGYFTGELEQKKLLQLLAEDSTLRSCPHGRPIMITLTRREIEKMFGRIV